MLFCIILHDVLILLKSINRKMLIKTHNMFKNLHFIIFVFFISFIPGLLAQTPNNIKVEYENLNTLPDALNICGASDEATVIISTDGTSTETRSDIEAVLTLFKGVRFINIVPSKTTPGVVLIDTSNVSKPIFKLPDLKTTFGAINTIKITYKIAADCNFLDTLAKNNNLTVYDVWQFNYVLESQRGLIEYDNTAEYRDAFEVPVFSIAALDKFNSPKKGGDCFSRKVAITNSGLRGHVSNFTYRNMQGKAILLKRLLINGDPIVFTKTPQPNGDTLIEAKVTSNYFVKNRKGNSGTLGNGDQLFDPDENLVVTEDICIANCSSSTFSTHSVSWGCFGEECDVKTINQTIPVGIGTPNPVFSSNGSVPSTTVGYCQEATSVAVYKNEGTEVDAGFGTMYDVVASLGIGSSFESKIKGYRVTSLKVAGKDINYNASTTVDFGKNNLFKTDPDGAGGLTDADNDGYFDDLPIGQSIEMIVKYEFLCNDNDTTQLCTNERNLGISAVIKYRNACNEKLDKINENFQNVSNNNNGFEDLSTTDAYIGKLDTFFMSHFEERSMFFFEKNCGGNEKIYAKIKLPKGVLPALNKFGLFKNGNTSPIVRLSDKIVNDTLYLTFDGTDPYMTGKYLLKMAFYATCDAEIGLTKFPIEFGIECPSCACLAPWYCNSITGPTLHGSDICKLQPCPIGIRTTDFEVNRTTFGYTDATFKTPVNPKNVNKKVAISCDSVAIAIRGVVGATILNDSIGVHIGYSNILDKNIPATNIGEILRFGNGKLKIGTGAQAKYCDIPGSAAKFTAGVNKVLKIDLNKCLGQGVVLNPNDSIQFLGNFFLLPDGPYSTQFKNIPNLRGYLYYIDKAKEYKCDDFGENFVVSKTRTVFDFPTSASFPKGCATANLDYRLITINNGFRDYFPKEYRQAVLPDSIYLKFDPSLLNSFENLAVEYSIPGHPIYGNEPIPLTNLKKYPNGQVSINFDTLQYSVAALNNVSYYSFLFRIKATPNCKSLTGSKDGNNRFDFDATLKYTDRYYAKEIGDGSCAIDSVAVTSNAIYYTEPPTLAFNPVSNPNFDLVGDTAIWTVKVCNTSIYSDANNSWLAIENPNDKLDIVSIEELSKNGVFNILPIKKYNTNSAFVSTKALLASNGANNIDDVCTTVRIKALAKSCGSQKITALAGWDCSPKPANWNPAINPPCEDYKMDLRIIAQEPSIDATLDEGFNINPDLCDTLYLDLLVRNTGKAKAYNIDTKLWLPVAGATLVPGSIQIAYPSGAAFKTVNVNPAKKGVSSKGQLYEYESMEVLNTYLHLNGLPAFNASNPTDSNEFKIRYKVVTDCEFKSGTISYFAVEGQKACGEKTNLETGESKPIRLKGAILTNNQRIFDIAITDNTLIIPTLVSTIEIEVINTTSFLSDNTDRMSIKLPEGLSYRPNTSVGVFPQGYIPGEPEIKIVNNQQVLLFPIATGLGLNERAVIKFFTTVPNFDCEKAPLFEANIETVVTRSIKCLSNPNSQPCILDIITSKGGESIVELPVSYEGALALNYLNVTSKCENDGEFITIIGNITNLDSLDYPDFPIEVKYFVDANENGLLDDSENIIKIFTASGPLQPNESIPVKHQFSVSANDICFIRAKVSAEGATCTKYTYQMPTPHLLNAGEDKGVCIFVGDNVIASIGVNDCKNTEYQYEWSVLGGLNINDFITNPNVPAASLNINWKANFPDTLVFVLQTNRGTKCSATKDTVLVFKNNANAPKATISSNLSKLCAGNTAILTATGGAEFLWTDSNGSVIGNKNTITVNPKATTTYFVKVTDANGCKDTTHYTITPLATPVVTASPDITLCLLKMATLSASVSGGTNYIYNWEPTLGLNNPTLQNPVAKPGETTVYTVTAIDANGCKGSDEVRVQIDTCQKCIPPMVDVTQIKKSQCGASTGSVQLYLWGGGHQNFIFDWTPNVGTSDDYGAARYNLPSGIYTVKISHKEDTTCNGTFKIVVPSVQPKDITINVDGVTDATCLTLQNGKVNFNIKYPSGFNTLVDTIITDGKNKVVNGQLTEGDYFVSVVAKNGCLLGAAPFKIALKSNDAIQIAATVTDRCDKNNQKGAINLQVSGGTGVYTFDWADLVGSNDPKDRLNVNEGAYNIKVIDANGCSAEQKNIVVKRCDNDNTGGNTPSFSVNYNVINIKCHSESTGKIDYTVIGEPSVIAKTTTIITTDGIKVFENGKLPANNYYLILKNENGVAIDSLQFAVTQPQPLNLDASIVNKCNGVLGAITLNITGGTSPYNYYWSDLSTSAATKDRTALEVGNYTVTVADSNNCIEIKTFKVDLCPDDSTHTNGGNPKFATGYSVVQPKCFGDNTGKIEFSIVGDTTLVSLTSTYITKNGSDTYTNGNLSEGNYTLFLIDKQSKILDSIKFQIRAADKINIVGISTKVCDNVKGAIDLSISGGASPYTIDWADLDVTPEPEDRTGLSEGNYSVIVADNNGCKATQSFLITNCKDSTNSGNPRFSTQYTVIQPKCFGANTGSISFSVEGDSVLISQTSTFITDGITHFNNGDLAAGNYSLILLDAQSRGIDTIDFVITQPSEIIISPAVKEVCKSTKGEIAISITGGTAPYTFDWADLTAAEDTKDRVGLAVGTYSITITDANNCTKSLDNIIVKLCKDSTNVAGNCNPFVLDSLDVYHTNCNDAVTVCLPIANPDSFNIYVDGILQINQSKCSNFYYSYSQLPNSSFKLLDWNGRKGDFVSVNQLVDSMNVWDSASNWIINTAAKQIISTSNASSAALLNLQFMENSVPMTYALNYLAGGTGISLELSQGKHKISAVHVFDIQCKDSIFVNVRCDIQALKPDTQYVTMLIGDTESICLDLSELKGKVVSVTQGCSNKFIVSTMIDNKFCVNIKGENLGQDTLCFKICNQFGICDYSYVIIDVNKPLKDVYDSLYVAEHRTYCINYKDYGIEGSVSVTTTCDANLKGNISFYKNQNSDNCIDYSGVKVGFDTICVRVCEVRTNRCSDFKIIVKVLPTSQKLVYKDTVYVGESKSYCFILNGLQTNPKSFKNLCHTASGKDALIGLDANKICINYTGIQIGLDTACLEICDSIGTCITIDAFIWVISNLNPPIAVDDIDTVLINKSYLIDEMKNDTINGTLRVIEILTQPLYGNLTMTTDRKMQYLATDEAYCKNIDKFRYRICNQDGCDSAWVKLYIRCPKVTVFNGFSPNEDGNNDTFTITDIDFFPNNELKIYNRWGNQVYYKKGYNNEWSGNWNGHPLPDGTYYYVIDLNDEDHTVLSGYIQLNR